MKIVQPTKFKIRIADVGTNTFSGGYNKVEDEDALKLALWVNKVMKENFLLEKSAEPMFTYHLACSLLRQIDGYDKKELINDINKADTFLGKWKFHINKEGEDNGNN